MEIVKIKRVRGSPPYTSVCRLHQPDYKSWGTQIFNIIALKARPLLAQLYTPMILFTSKPAKTSCRRGRGSICSNAGSHIHPRLPECSVPAVTLNCGSSQGLACPLCFPLAVLCGSPKETW